MGANDVHGADLHHELPVPISEVRVGTAARVANFGNGTGCYKATVNESETITEAQPLCWVRGRSEANGSGPVGFRPPAAPHIERS